MSWSISNLWSDMTNAWSAENWPYTLAFWGVIALVGLAVTYLSRRRTGGNKRD